MARFEITRYPPTALGCESSEGGRACARTAVYVIDSISVCERHLLEHIDGAI